MITLLGVGHVFDLRSAVRDAIHARRPRVVALELDATRYHVLARGGSRARGWSTLGLLARFEERIAAKYGVRVGDEMIAGALAAREVGAEIALIDVDSREVILRVLREMSLVERIRFFGSILRSLFVGQERVEEEIERYHADESGVLAEFASVLPTAKRILVDERDAHMARRLIELHGAKGDVVALVGDGHVGGLVQGLRDQPVEVLRLRDLRSPPASGPGGTATVSFDL
ncbi:MAG: hypothetical protein A3K68_07745 [Euryarchaeota archaeon RBG_16_68_13]|nr:MAG: hypothetical protein A3K68_07745 [Euryarchaeota archaeon RBG_16_68_13]